MAIYRIEFETDPKRDAKFRRWLVGAERGSPDQVRTLAAAFNKMSTGEDANLIGGITVRRIERKGLTRPQ